MGPKADEQLARARTLNAIAAIDEGALSREGAPSVLVKDNIAVAGMSWTAGSPIFAGTVARRDAAGVRSLREAGACFPIRTTLHELAFGVTGDNGWTGAIVNPHDESRVAGGSSGGSAAALALGLGDLSLVTDTGGSARVPAAFCGVIGFRPSTGRYPADGMIGLSHSRDTLGLMARTMAPILWADAVLAGDDGAERDAPARATIGVLNEDQLGAIEPDVLHAYRRSIAVLEAQGHRMVECDLSQAFALDEACGFPIALHETGQALLSSVPALTGRALDDVLDQVATPDVQHLLGLALDGQTVPAAVYADAIGRQWPALRKAFEAVFASGPDFLLQPTAPLTAPALGSADTVDLNGEAVPAFPTITRYTRPDSMAGLPAISLPSGCDGRGLPIGMMLTARRGADAMLLRFADALGGSLAETA